MKYILSFVGVVAVLCGIFLFSNKKEDEPLRIHIVANSNSYKDEQVKYDVKETVINFLNPLLEDVKDKKQAKEIVSNNIKQIKMIVENTLKKSDINYGAKIEIVREKMPMRAYADVAYDTGVYDSLKIELGQGEGDNWWCVVFPSVCFLN